MINLKNTQFTSLYDVKLNLLDEKKQQIFTFEKDFWLKNDSKSISQLIISVLTVVLQCCRNKDRLALFTCFIPLVVDVTMMSLITVWECVLETTVLGKRND